MDLDGPCEQCAALNSTESRFFSTQETPSLLALIIEVI